METQGRDGVEFGSVLDTLAWLVDVKGRDEHKEALRALNDTLNDAARRLERAHDEADKYQVRALDAEAEVQQLREERDLASNAHEAAELRIVELRTKLARVEALLDWAGPLPIAVLREALRDEPKTVEAER